jgi:hypothetical protein
MQDIDSNSGSPSPPALKDPVIIHSQEEASFEARGPPRRPDGDLRRRCLTLAPRRAIVSSFAEATDSETRHQVRDDGDTGSGGADDEADADGNGDVAIAPRSDAEETIRMIDDADVLKIEADSVAGIEEINNAPSNYNINMNSGKGPENGETVLISNSPSGYADCVESAILAGLTAHVAYDLAEEIPRSNPSRFFHTS